MKIVKVIQEAHEDGISFIAYANNGLNIISTGHDGFVKIWDLRNYKVVAEIENGKNKKYDEGIICLATHSQAPFFASGGADCIINIYELNL